MIYATPTRCVTGFYFTQTHTHTDIHAYIHEHTHNRIQYNNCNIVVVVCLADKIGSTEISRRQEYVVGLLANDCCKGF